MGRTDIGRTLAAGLAATSVLAVFACAAPHYDLPPSDPAAWIASLFCAGRRPPIGSALWWEGMTLYVALGSVLCSLIYACFVYKMLETEPWLRGLSWGLILWFIAMTAGLPMAGKGFFAENTVHPGLVFCATLVGFAMYGVILGVGARPQTVPGDLGSENPGAA